MKEYSQLDDMAYKIFFKDLIKRNKRSDRINMIGKHYFVYHKDYFPYEPYYKIAKSKLRKEKISKILNENT